MASKQRFPARLIEGYRQFKNNDLSRFRVLSEAGQRPETLLISCCDSRSAPETIFNSDPGELFVIRNVANLVPKYEADSGFHGTSAAIEFAVKSLRVRNIVVMGHGRCGGVKGFLTPGAADGSPFLAKWLTLLEPAYAGLEEARDLREMPEHLTVNSVQVELEGVKNLMSKLSSFTDEVEALGAAVNNAEVKGTSAKLHIDVQSREQVSAIDEIVHELDASSSKLVLPDRDQTHALELASVVQSLENLKSFPALRDLVNVGDLDLYGSWFDIGEGRLLTYDQTEKNWSQLD